MVGVPTGEPPNRLESCLLLVSALEERRNTFVKATVEMSGFAPPSEYYASEIHDCTEARGGSTIIEVSNKTLLSSTEQDLIAPFTHLVISLLAVNLVAVR